MNKKELITSMLEKINLNKINTEKLLNSFIETIQETLKNGQSVQLIGFDMFQIKEISTMVGLN